MTGSALAGHPVLQLAAALFALVVSGAAVVTLVRRALVPWFDVAVVGALTRNSATVERHMRETMFRDDLKARDELRATATQALELSRANAEAIRALVANQGELAAAVAELPQVSGELARCSNALERVTEGMERISSQVNQMAGVVGMLVRQAPGGGGAPAGVPQLPGLPGVPTLVGG